MRKYFHVNANLENSLRVYKRHVRASEGLIPQTAWYQVAFPQLSFVAALGVSNSVEDPDTFLAGSGFR